MAEPIRVILNDRVLFRPLTGVGYYVQQLLRALGEEALRADVRPFLSCCVPVPGSGEPREAVGENDLGRQGPPRTRTWLKQWLRRILEPPYEAAFRWKARSFQLYHEPNHIPIACRLPTVTTVHDLSVLLHPEWHPADRVRWYEREFKRGQEQTCRFLVPSEFTKREMIDHLGVDRGRVDVFTQAPRPGLQPRGIEQVQRVLERLRLPEHFLLFVGTLEPRKNMLGLIEAFAALPPAVRRRYPLVLAGEWGWNTEALAAKLASCPCRKEIRLLGRVSDDALACLYSVCAALVWPSLYEGFGLPPLEAMACGSPAIVSDVASLPEVVGNAAVLLDPRDPAAWTAAVQRMVEDDAWRGEWRRRGQERAAMFTWQNCALQTVAAYEATVRDRV